jgi:peptide/nickel transport system permease protein
MDTTRLARYASRRLVLMLFSLLGVSAVTFAVVNVLPGDVAVMILGTKASEARLQVVRQQLGLNQPLWMRYIDWLTGVLTGDFGRSLKFDLPVARLIAQRLPASAFLAFTALLIAVLISIPLGVFAAMERDSVRDLGTSIFAFLGMSLPNFFWGILLILVFAKYMNLLPPTGYVNPLADPIGGFQHVLLPALALSFALMAHFTRMTRSSILEELRAGYIQLARSKGLSERRIVYRHALRNAFLPVLTIIGFQVGYLFGGIVIIEQLFAYNGLGSLTYQALLNRDAPLIEGTILVIATITMTSNLIVDLLYAVLDPRVGSREGS